MVRMRKRVSGFRASGNSRSRRRSAIWLGIVAGGFALSRYLAHSGVECSGEIAFCAEFEFGLAVQRFGLNPGIEPREIVGSLQQRLWSLRTATPEDLIPDNAQQGSQKQTGSDANGGGSGDSHDAPFTLALMMPDCVSSDQIAEFSKPNCHSNVEIRLCFDTQCDNNVHGLASRIRRPLIRSPYVHCSRY